MINTPFTLVQIEESYENYYGDGASTAVTVCQNSREVSEFVFRVIYDRFVKSDERAFHAEEL